MSNPNSPATSPNSLIIPEGNEFLVISRSGVMNYFATFEAARDWVRDCPDFLPKGVGEAR